MSLTLPLTTLCTTAFILSVKKIINFCIRKVNFYILFLNFFDPFFFPLPPEDFFRFLPDIAESSKLLWPKEVMSSPRLPIVIICFRRNLKKQKLWLRNVNPSPEPGHNVLMGFKSITRTSRGIEGLMVYE